MRESSRISPAHNAAVLMYAPESSFIRPTQERVLLKPISYLVDILPE